MILTACGEAGKVPKGVIEQEKMTQILMDMNFADVFSREMPNAFLAHTDSAREQQLKESYLQILQLHKVSVKEFMDSYSYYESHADKLKIMYDSMEARVKRMKVEADTLEQRRLKQIQDSVEAARNKSLDSIKNIYGEKINADSIFNKYRDSLNKAMYQHRADSIKKVSDSIVAASRKMAKAKADSIKKGLKAKPHISPDSSKGIKVQ